METKRAIGGKVRENNFNNSKLVGLGEVKVVAINPNSEEYKEILNIDLKEDSKATDYVGESKDGNRSVRIDIWVENVLTKKRDKITYFLEDKVRVNKEGTKTQFINNIGVCTWAEDDSKLPAWFTKREYREAHNGEEEFYKFLRFYLGKLDYSDSEAFLSFEWKTLIKGNLKDVKELIGCEYCTNFLSLYTVKIVKKEGQETKEYQSIYNKDFLPTYRLKIFNTLDFDNETVLNSLKNKTSKKLEDYERFVLAVKGQHGCKDIFILKPQKEYISSEYEIVNNDNAILSEEEYAEMGAEEEANSDY